MANIIKRNGTYRITVSLGYDQNNKQKRISTTYKPDASKSKRVQDREARQFADEFEAKVKSGQISNGENLTLAEFVPKWLKEYGEQELEETTLQDYQAVLRRILPSLGRYKMSELNPLIVKEFLNSQKMDGARLDGKPGAYGDKTVMKTKQVLSIILSTAVEWGIMSSNPCVAARLRSNKKVGTRKIKYFTYEQAKTFLEAIDRPLVVKISGHKRVDDTGKPYLVNNFTKTIMLDLQFRFLFNLTLFSGCRREELLALTWKDFDFEENCIRITKAVCKIKGETKLKGTKTDSSNRVVYLPESVIHMAREYQEQQRRSADMLEDKWAGKRGQDFDENYVFTQWDGRIMYLTTPNSKLKRVIRLINNSIEDEKNKLPPITLHGLRHTNATLLIAQNLDVVTVAGRLGHSDTSTTLNIYAHALREKNQQAGKILGDIFEQKDHSSQ